MPGLPPMTRYSASPGAARWSRGGSSVYCHPATERSPALAAAMPGYRNPEELAALLSPRVKRRIEELGIDLVGYRDLAAPG